MRTPPGSHRSFGGAGIAILWSFVLQIGTKAIFRGSGFVIAYFIGPREFGLVAMATVFINFMQLFLNAGFTTAIIQAKELERDQIDTVFWLNMGMSVAFTLGVIGISSWWAGVNRTPELAFFLRMLAVTLVMRGGSLVQEALAQRDKDFKSLATRSNLAGVLGGVVGITWAAVSPSAYAILAQRFVVEVLQLALLWRLRPWRPSFRFSPQAAKDLLVFSGSVLLGRIGLRASRHSDALLLGLFFGPTVVGVYRLAKSLAESGYQVTIKPLILVAMPQFSERQDDHERLRESLATYAKYSAIAAAPTLLVLSAISRPLTAMLGPEWMPAAAPLAVLSVATAARALTAFTEPLLFALGRPLLVASLVIVPGVFMPSSYVLAAWLLADAGTHMQLLGVSLAELGTGLLIVTPITFWVTGREIGQRWAPVLLSLIPAVLAGGAASGSAWGCTQLLDALPHVVNAVGSGLVGAAVGVGALLLLDGDTSALARIALNKVRSRKKPT